SWSSLSSAQVEESSSAPASDTQTDSADALAVNLKLIQTALSREAILLALQDEFRVPVVETSATTGLHISIEAHQLQVSYREDAQKVVDREMLLPESEPHQLKTIA